MPYEIIMYLFSLLLLKNVTITHITIIVKNVMARKNTLKSPITKHTIHICNIAFIIKPKVVHL